MKLSYTTYLIGKNLNFDESVALAVKTGCAGIEFRTGGIFPHGVEVSLTARQRKEKRRAIEDKFLEVACINSPHELHNPSAAERKKVVAAAVKSVELAADLGCTRVRIFGNHIPEKVNAQDCVAYVGEALGEIADEALPMGVDVLLEMHGQFNYWGYTIPAVKHADRCNVGLLYNCDNRDLVGGSVSETFSRVKPIVKHIHMHGVESGFPYLELFEELVRMDYQGYISAEVDATSDPYRVLKIQNTAVRALIDLARMRVGYIK